MDKLSYEKAMNEFSEKIRAAQDNEMALDKLELEQRKTYLKAQNDFEEAKGKKVDQDQLKVYEAQMALEEECVNLVTQAVEALENRKYPEQTPAPEAAVPVEMTPTEVDKKTKDVERKKKEPAEPKLKFIQHLRSQNMIECDPLTLLCTCQGDDDDLELMVKRISSLLLLTIDHESGRYILTNDEKEFSLEIPIVSPVDEGQYTVVISNDKAQMIAAFSLHIDKS